MKELWDEIWEELADFIEDFDEHIRHKPSKDNVKTKTAVVRGVKVAVRPAYLFAERVDNVLKFIFGVSIIFSAISATFLGFIKLSDLLEVLINTLTGRIIMLVIGFSYLITAIWKLMHLGDKK